MGKDSDPKAQVEQQMNSSSHWDLPSATFYWASQSCQVNTAITEGSPALLRNITLVHEEPLAPFFDYSSGLDLLGAAAEVGGREMIG